MVKTLHFPFDHLPPAFDRFQILHISDPHFSRDTPLSPRAQELIAAIEADICVLTGDFLWGKTGPYDAVIEQTACLSKIVRARDGIFAVLGNHDHSAFIEPFAGLGLRVLMNEHVSIARGTERIWLAGVDDPSFFETGDPRLAVTGVPNDGFIILLAHSPEAAMPAAECGVRLYLCGHTHCGQIRFPFLGALHLNSRAPRRYCCSVWRLGTMKGYTSAGLGTTELAVRFNCPPEIALIELRRG